MGPCAGVGHVLVSIWEAGELPATELCDKGFVGDVVMREWEDHSSVLGKLVENMLNFVVRGLVILV